MSDEGEGERRATRVRPSMMGVATVVSATVVSGREGHTFGRRFTLQDRGNASFAPVNPARIIEGQTFDLSFSDR
jgi:hypothetical protein